jgi:phospholipid transport system substrate-binding protein
MRKCVVILLIVFLNISFGFTSTPQKAKKLVEDAIASVIKVIKEEPDLKKGARRDKIMSFISPVFDFNLMAKLSLGKTNWKLFTKEQRKEYTDLFITLLKNTYLSKAEQFKDEVITFKDPVVNKKKVLVLSTIASKGSTYTIAYKLRLVKEEWKIYDLEIQEISIIKSYRNQFGAILKNDTPKDLLKQMREKFIKS